VKKTERLDEAVAPDGTVLTLFRHDDAYFIRVNGVELMSTRRHQSEEKLAELCCAPLRHARAPRVLIGGLGMGFTLQAALRSLPPDANVVVAEIVGRVVEWNANAEYPFAGAAMTDVRVDVRQDDVWNLIANGAGQYDGIMLDVDNGAEALTTSSNARLYRRSGVARAIAALRRGGRLGYWLSNADPEFAESLRGTGLTVESHKVRAHDTAGGYYMLYIVHTD
jgi:spermidine synthase